MTNFNQSKILASRLLQGSAIIGLAAMWATGAMAQAANSGNTQVAETIETVTVTGTAIRGIIAPVGDNVITVDRDTIEATGANDVQQLLTTIPSVTGFGNPGQGGFGSADGSGTNAPTIHSLGASASNSTLILVDDHRIPLSGLAHSLSDPSTIPTIALQRVEVLADGASSIYGSDAVAGVINFITRRNYEGAETDVEYGDGLSYNQFTASQIIGTRWDHGSFMAALSILLEQPVAGQRPLFRERQPDLPGIVQFGQLCRRSGHHRLDQLVRGLSLSLYGRHRGHQHGDGNALYGQARYSALLPSENRNAALVNVTEDVSDWLTVSAQLNWSSRIDNLAVGRNPGAGAAAVARASPRRSMVRALRRPMPPRSILSMWQCPARPTASRRYASISIRSSALAPLPNPARRLPMRRRKPTSSWAATGSPRSAAWPARRRVSPARWDKSAPPAFIWR